MCFGHRVKGTWRVADSAMRKSLLNVQNLVKQFDSFEILCCDAARQHNSTGATTKVARHHMETVLSGKPNAISYPGYRFRFLTRKEPSKNSSGIENTQRISCSRYLD